MTEYATNWIDITDVGSTVVPSPEGAARADIVIIGGGGGGQENTFNRRGGSAGSWAYGTVETSGSINVTVGSGGVFRSNGGASTAAGMTAPGGTFGASSVTAGVTAETITVFGRTFVGGRGGIATSGSTGLSIADYMGHQPGGGASGATASYSTSNGICGGDGAAYIRWWINPKIENLYVGGQQIHGVYLGGQEIQAVYHGSKLIYGTS